MTPEAAAILTGLRPLHRRPPAERAVIVAALAGQRVTVYDDLHRDGTEQRPHTGELVGLAWPTGAGTAELVIVDTDTAGLRAISSARVSRIELAR